MVGGLYLAYAIAMVALHPQAIYPFGADPFENPAFEKVIIADRAVPMAVARGDGPLAVLYFMGNGGSLAYFTYSLDTHVNTGRTLAAMEYRGGAGIDGRPSEAGLKADALAAYDWLADQHDGPIVVHGFSLGTGLAVHVAARRSVAAIVLDAPYARLCSLMAKASYLPACLMPGVQKWNSAADVDQLASPVLIQHGTADQLIPIGNGEQLSDLLTAAGVDVEFFAAAGATHNNIAGQAGYADRIAAFLARTVNE
jgi:fermentation-respiration switch protein FrsA (DUF1100 family)